MVMPLIVGQEWRRRISRMQWLLNAVLAVECLSMPFFAAGAVAGMVWYGGRRMGADWGWLAGGALAAAGLFLAVWGWLRLRGRFFSRRDTAAFLDEQLGLHAALSAGEEWGNAVEAGESAVPFDAADGDGLNFLAGKTMDFIRTQAMDGTLLAHEEGGVPNIILRCGALDADTLGQLIYFFEYACGLSGYLLDVNPFDQPGVEAYKKNMFALLGKPGYEDRKAELEAKLTEKH